MLIGIGNHLLGQLYTVTIMIGPNSTIRAYFCITCEGVSFFPSKGKNETVFFKSKIDLYKTQIDPALSDMKKNKSRSTF